MCARKRDNETSLEKIIQKIHLPNIGKEVIEGVGIPLGCGIIGYALTKDIEGVFFSTTIASTFMGRLAFDKSQKVAGTAYTIAMFAGLIGVAVKHYIAQKL